MKCAVFLHPVDGADQDDGFDPPIVHIDVDPIPRIGEELHFRVRQLDGARGDPGGIVSATISEVSWQFHEFDDDDGFYLSFRGNDDECPVYIEAKVGRATWDEDILGKRGCSVSFGRGDYNWYARLLGRDWLSGSVPILNRVRRAAGRISTWLWCQHGRLQGGHIDGGGVR